MDRLVTTAQHQDIDGNIGDGNLVATLSVDFLAIVGERTIVDVQISEGFTTEVSGVSVSPTTEPILVPEYSSVPEIEGDGDGESEGDDGLYNAQSFNENAGGYTFSADAMVNDLSYVPGADLSIVGDGTSAAFQEAFC